MPPDTRRPSQAGPPLPTRSVASSGRLLLLLWVLPTALMTGFGLARWDHARARSIAMRIANTPLEAIDPVITVTSEGAGNPGPVVTVTPEATGGTELAITVTPEGTDNPGAITVTPEPGASTAEPARPATEPASATPTLSVTLTPTVDQTPSATSTSNATPTPTRPIGPWVSRRYLPALKRNPTVNASQ